MLSCCTNRRQRLAWIHTARNSINLSPSPRSLNPIALERRFRPIPRERTGDPFMQSGSTKGAPVACTRAGVFVHGVDGTRLVVASFSLEIGHILAMDAVAPPGPALT